MQPCASSKLPRKRVHGEQLSHSSKLSCLAADPQTQYRSVSKASLSTPHPSHTYIHTSQHSLCILCRTQSQTTPVALHHYFCLRKSTSPACHCLVSASLCSSTVADNMPAQLHDDDPENGGSFDCSFAIKFSGTYSSSQHSLLRSCCSLGPKPLQHHVGDVCTQLLLLQACSSQGLCKCGPAL